MDSHTSYRYPVFMDLRNKAVLLVGGGNVAFRKARTLITSGCTLTVVSKQTIPSFKSWLKARNIQLEQRSYKADEAADYHLVISATNDAKINRRVFEDADRAGRLINVVDQPHLCNIFVPALIQRDNLQVAISTNGQCPALARRLRLDLEAIITPAYGPLLEHLAAMRRHIIRTIPEAAKRKQLLERSLDSRAVQRFLSGDELPLKRMRQGWKRAKAKSSV